MEVVKPKMYQSCFKTTTQSKYKNLTKMYLVLVVTSPPNVILMKDVIFIRS